VFVLNQILDKKYTSGLNIEWKIQKPI
jgi:hypothetical protein